MLSCKPANSHGHHLLPGVKPNVLVPVAEVPCPAPTHHCAEPRPAAEESSKCYKAPFSSILRKYTQTRYGIRSSLGKNHHLFLKWSIDVPVIAAIRF